MFESTASLFCLIGAIATVSASIFGPGAGLIAFDYIRCAGTEPKLINCPSLHGRPCTHNEDSGVRCQVRTGTIIQTTVNVDMIW